MALYFRHFQRHVTVTEWWNICAGTNQLPFFLSGLNQISALRYFGPPPKQRSTCAVHCTTSASYLRSLWLINKMHFLNEKTLIAKVQKIRIFLPKKFLTTFACLLKLRQVTLFMIPTNISCNHPTWNNNGKPTVQF